MRNGWDIHKTCSHWAPESIVGEPLHLVGAPFGNCWSKCERSLIPICYWNFSGVKNLWLENDFLTIFQRFGSFDWCSSPFPRALPYTKEILPILFHFSSPKSFTVNGLLEADSSWHKTLFVISIAFRWFPSVIQPQIRGYPMENILKLYMLSS